MKCPKCSYDNDENALYCGLCYEPLKKAARNAPAEAPAEAPETAKAAGPLLKIALIAGILSGAGVYFYGGSGPAGRAQAALQAVRLQEQTLAAENLLAAHNRAREELLKEITEKTDAGGFGLEGQYTKKLFKLEDDYVSGLGAIQLGCPECAGNSAYIKWSEGYKAKETAAMEDFNKKYLLLARKAADR